MTSTHKLSALAAAGLLVLLTFGPAAVAAVSATTGNEAAGGGNAAAGNAGELAIGVNQGADRVTVAVTHNGSGVANATVTVTANATYNGTGTYQTDADGFVVLPAPNRTVDVTITAEKDGMRGETTATLHASEGRGPEFLPPGQQVSAFVKSLVGSDLDRPLGLYVADFLRGAHPDGPPADAGPPEDAGQPDDAGPPEDAGQPDDAGPPEDAGQPDDAGADQADESSDDSGDANDDSGNDDQ